MVADIENGCLLLCLGIAVSYWGTEGRGSRNGPFLNSLLQFLKVLHFLGEKQSG